MGKVGFSPSVTWVRCGKKIAPDNPDTVAAEAEAFSSSSSVPLVLQDGKPHPFHGAPLISPI
jgi:hypothetical protein